MKYIYLTLLSLMATLCATAQEYAICIAHGNMQDYALTTDIDSIYFDASGTTLYVQPMAGGSPVQFAAADVQAISSLPASDMPLSLLVNFNGDAATIANPFFLQGVSVETDGAYVTITNNNLTTELSTSLSGIINFAGGTTVCYATNNDAVDSNYGRSGAITISGGNLFAYSGAGGAEEGIDCDNNSYITVTGGIAISAGGSQGGGGMGSSSSSIGSASQPYYLGSSPSSYSSTYYYTLCNTSGEAICTYRFEKNVSNSLSLLTAPNLGTGSITVKQGTSAPTSASIIVKSTTDAPVFWIAPEVSTTSTAATITSK